MKTTLIIVGALASSILSAASAEWSETNGLAVRISADSRTLRPGQILRIRVEIKNTSTNGTVIHTSHCPWERLIVTGTNGTEHESYPNAISEPLPPSPAHFIHLAPDTVYTNTLYATLHQSHTFSNAFWHPRFMKLVARMRDYDLPPGPFALHYRRREFQETQLKVGDEWDNL